MPNSASEINANAVADEKLEVYIRIPSIKIHIFILEGMSGDF